MSRPTAAIRVLRKAYADVRLVFLTSYIKAKFEVRFIAT